MINGSSSWFIAPFYFRLFSNFIFRLAVAGADFGLHLLTKSATSSETVFPFGSGLSGHHGKVNDMSLCGGRSEDSHRYVATVSGDDYSVYFDAANKF